MVLALSLTQIGALASQLRRFWVRYRTWGTSLPKRVGLWGLCALASTVCHLPGAVAQQEASSGAEASREGENENKASRE